MGTPEFKNNENPNFAWGCPFAYDGALNFDGEVWDSDIGRDDLVGEIASSGGIKIDENFLNQFDKDGDGRFDLGLYIFSNGNKGGESIVRFRFELIKSPGYELRRVGSSYQRDPQGIGRQSFAVADQSDSVNAAGTVAHQSYSRGGGGFADQPYSSGGVNRYSRGGGSYGR